MEQPELLAGDIRKFVNDVIIQSQSGRFLESIPR
jgi:hypothetical protein